MHSIFMQGSPNALQTLAPARQRRMMCKSHIEVTLLPHQYRELFGCQQLQMAVPAAAYCRTEWPHTMPKPLAPAVGS